ncbi:hypothetical protein D3C84_1238500 [compost metagenome]
MFAKLEATNRTQLLKKLLEYSVDVVRKTVRKIILTALLGLTNIVNVVLVTTNTA